MKRVASIDGELVAMERALVSVFDRGFLYGDAVFETLRIYAGRPFACREHLDRLTSSCAALRIALPVPVERIEDELSDAIAASTLAEAYARICVTRGVGERTTLVPGGAERATRVILVESLTVPTMATYARGVRAITLPWSARGEGSPASGAKLPSYVAALLALQEARLHGADEAIFIAKDNIVRDATTSNVVVVAADGSLVVPDGVGVLAGITRRHVLEIARASGHEVAIRRVACWELRAAREIFLTSSIREIASVVQLDGQCVGSGEPGPVARALHAAYRELCAHPGLRS